MSLVVGDWQDICAGAIGGAPGSGKTTTARFIAGQAALKGAQLILVDPHGNAVQNREQTLGYSLSPLKPAFVLDTATQRADMIYSVKAVHSELKARIDGKHQGPPWLLIFDEFNNAIRDDTELELILGHLLESIAAQGRKFLIMALILSHQWYVDRIGGGQLRSVLAGRWLHNMPADAAKLLIPQRGMKIHSDQLRTGEVIFLRRNGERMLMKIPKTTFEHMKRVGRILEERNPQIAAQPSTKRSAEWAVADDPKQTFIMGQFLAGKDVSEIAQDLGKGRAYKDNLTFVNMVLRRELNLRGY